MKASFQTVDVFTDRQFGGNPVAVIPNARGLSDAQMQAIANEFNLAQRLRVASGQFCKHRSCPDFYASRRDAPGFWSEAQRV